MTATPSKPVQSIQPITAIPVCCYCDHALSCAHCGMEQPDDDVSALVKALEEIEQRANETGVGTMALVDTIHAMHRIATAALIPPERKDMNPKWDNRPACSYPDMRPQDLCAQIADDRWHHKYEAGRANAAEARLAGLRQAVLTAEECITPTERNVWALWLLQQVKEGKL